MMDWMLIGLGAGLGSVLRYEIARRMSSHTGKLLIPGTFVVNITGAFLLGIAVGISVHGLWWNFLADGFLGGFTTFSTLVVEGVHFVKDKRKVNALLYFSSTAVLGVSAFLLGGMVV
jgi:CrcB protein